MGEILEPGQVAHMFICGQVGDGRVRDIFLMDIFPHRPWCHV